MQDLAILKSFETERQYLEKDGLSVERDYYEQSSEHATTLR